MGLLIVLAIGSKVFGVFVPGWLWLIAGVWTVADLLAGGAN